MTSQHRLLMKIKKKLETEEKLGKRLLLLALLAIVKSLKTPTLGSYEFDFSNVDCSNDDACDDFCDGYIFGDPDAAMDCLMDCEENCFYYL